MQNVNSMDSNNNGKRRRVRRKGVKIKVGNVVVKIYFDANAENRKPYRVLWKDASGTVCREMFATLDEARTYAEKTATDLNNGQRPYTKEEIDSLFLLAARVKGLEQQLAPFSRTLEQVVTDVVAAGQILPGWTVSQMAAEIRERHSTVKRYCSVTQVADEFLKHVQSGFKRTYSRHYVAQQTKYAREFVAKHGALRIDLMSPKQVLEFVDGYRVQLTYRNKGIQPGTDGLMPATRKTKDSVYNFLRRFFDFARDVLEALPAGERTPAERVERPQVPPNQPAIFTLREVSSLFSVLPDGEMTLFAAVQVFAGLRPYEAIRLKGEDFQTDEHGNLVTILVRCGKKSSHVHAACRVRHAPITPPLKKLLGQVTLPSGLLFKRCRIESYLTEYARVARLVWKHDVLRHTFVSFRLLTVKNRQQVALEAGHTVSIQEGHYEGLVQPADVGPFWNFAPAAGNLPWQAQIPSIKKLARQRQQTPATLPLAA